MTDYKTLCLAFREAQQEIHAAEKKWHAESMTAEEQEQALNADEERYARFDDIVLQIADKLARDMVAWTELNRQHDVVMADKGIEDACYIMENLKKLAVGILNS